MMKRKRARLVAMILSVVMVLPTLNPVFAATRTNGTFTGTAAGRGGQVQVTIQMEDDRITDIGADGPNETPAYWNAAIEVLETIKENNGTENVDAIAGATLSSKAILEAANKALNKALPGFSSGSGSANNPYLISSDTQLFWFADQVNGGEPFEGAYISLDADLELTEEWTPIGSNSSMPFAGVFNGQGHTISGMQIGASADPAVISYAGLFGYVKNTAEIRNLHLEDVAMVIQGSGTSYAGALVAYAENKSSSGLGTVLDHCTVEGSLVMTNTAATMAGGLIGFGNQYGLISNCGADVAVSIDAGGGILNAGGLIGMASINSMVINSYSLGSVNGRSSSSTNSNVGGLAGTLSGIYYNDYTAGEVTTTGDKVRVGGLAGNVAAAAIAIRTYWNENLADAAGNLSGVLHSSSAGKSETALSSQEFADLMSGGLSSNAREVGAVLAAEKITAITMADMTDKIGNEFYDWQFKGGSVVLSSTLWSESEIDTSIFAGGSGTEESPYLISNESQLRKFAVSFTSKIDYSGKYVALTDDITLTEEWMPIGEGEYAFCGVFDGNGRTISQLRIGSSSSPKYDEIDTRYFGLFGVLENATVKNLNIEAEIYTAGEGSLYVGALAGYAENTLVDGLSVSGNVSGTSGNGAAGSLWKANHFGGGLIGYQSKGALVNSTSHATVFSGAQGGLAEAGGLVGLSNRALIANCYSTGDISGMTRRGNIDGREYEGMAAVGGIAGVFAGTMVQCYSSAKTSTDTYSTYVGVLAGWVTGIGNLYKSYYTTDSIQEIEGRAISPVEYAGWLVGPGINDEGEAYTGSIAYGMEGITAAETGTEAFAAKLNANFDELSVDVETLWPKAVLKKWILHDGEVKPNGAAAVITYVQPDIPEAEFQGEYYDGTYFGRSEDKTLIVKVEIAKDKIQDISVSSYSGEIFDFSNLLQQIKSSNGISTLTGADAATIRLKDAVSTVFKKAILWDTTGYGSVSASIFAGGTGTQQDPYQISTETQLRAFAASVNTDESYHGKYVKLTKNITLTGEWQSIGGNAPHVFKGTFDGNYKTISNLKTGSKSEPANIAFAGLFSYLSEAVVKNLTLKNVEIHAKNSGSRNVFVAGLAATAGEVYEGPCYISGITVNGNLSARSNTGAAYIGAVSARLEKSVVNNCSADVHLAASSQSGSRIYAGGLLGIFARSAVISNVAKGSIQVSSTVNKTASGGVTGFHSGVSFNNVTDMDIHSVKATTDIGGVAGRNTGIGLMLPGYYSESSSQQNGDVPLSSNVGVGVIVTGTGGGCGAVEGLTSYQSEADLITTLNGNLTDSTIRERILQLLELWNVELPESITMGKWSVFGGGLVLDQSGSGVSLLNGRMITVEVPQDPDPTPTPSTGGSSGNTKSTTTTETSTDKDGTVTTKTINTKTGVVTTVSIKTNGDKATRIDQPDGSASIVMENKNGTSSKTQITSSGQVTSAVSLNQSSVSAAAGSALTLPVPTMPLVADRDVAPRITLNTEGKTAILVKIPVERVTSSTVVILVGQDGTETILKDSISDANGVIALVMPGATIKIINNNKHFEDVSSSAWYQEAVGFASGREILSGTGTSSFSPSEPMTRGMLWTALSRYDGQTGTGGETWYSSAQRWASENDVSDGSNPEGNITREQLASILYRYAGSPSVQGSLDGYKDAGQISSWADAALQWAVAKGILNGREGGLLDPQAQANRAEVAAILMRYIKDKNH
ncbi:FMN-binding protein [Anoxybacterium hadale]|uniref:FMN-binding protein n=1 Tax=Anoxybacterium hadale TaxID=3408580 RepID=A0ACD1ADQ1_9FIRM|nr:FMN-binding protein [Clostridiales bacterium]